MAKLKDVFQVSAKPKEISSSSGDGSKASSSAGKSTTKYSGNTTYRENTKDRITGEGAAKLDADLAAFNKKTNKGKSWKAGSEYKDSKSRQNENISDQWDQDRTEAPSTKYSDEANNTEKNEQKSYLSEANQQELNTLYDAWQQAVEYGDRDAEELGQKYQTRKAELESQTEQGQTERQKSYQELATEDDMYSGYATDPLTAMQMQGRSDERQAAKEALKEENRENDRPVYEGLAENDRISDATQSWLGGRLAGDAASVGALLGGIDANVGYIDDVHRDLVTRQRDAAYAGNYAEAERLQEEVDRYEQEHQGDNRTVLGDVSDALLSGSQDLQNTSEQQWQDVTEDMGNVGRTVANVAKTGADVALDIVENAIVPGAGTMRMYLGAGGSTALEQMGRENNDPNSVLVASVKGAATAYFSNKLLGGMEAAYGKSILGDITGRMVENAHPAVQTAVKTLLNTEGAEEGLEDILNYAADKILGLDPEAQLSWDEVKQDAFIGYVLGVLTNGLSAGINYDGAKRRALADEAIAFAESGMTLEEAEQVARETTREDVVMKPSAEPEAEVQETMDLEPEVQQSAPDVSNVAEPNRARPGEVITAEPAAEPQAASTPQAPQAAGGPTANREAYQGPRMPEASYGGGTTVKVGKSRIPVHYAVIPVSRLTASHDIYGNVNRNYPGELQPRDRTRGTSQAQALQIGQDLDPEQLEWSPTATGGAPIVRSDGVVISGNGRTLGINYAIQTGRGHDYTQYLRENAARFGIDPQSIQEDSVLVRVADGDYDWQQMAEEANVSTVSQMSTTEQAGVDAERLSRYPEILSLLAPNETGDLNTSDNREFVRQFLQAVVPESEQGNVWTENNGLSQSGLARIKNAVFQVAYGDASLMARLSESLDNNIKNVSNSLLAAAPKVAALENGVQNGTRYIGVRDQILAGVKLFEQAKSQGVEVSKIADQISADGNVGADAVFIAEFLQENFRSQKQIRSFLNAMADTAESYGDPTQIGFFDTVETAPTDREVLEGAIRKYEQETGKQPGELGSPDYDFYGERSGIFDFATNRQSQRGSQAQPDTANDRAAESTGENAGREPDVIDNLLGNEPKAAETAQNEPAPQREVNSQSETANSAESELNAQEQQETPSATPASPPTPPKPPKTPRSRREKISQYFTNTLTESHRTQGLDPITYNPTSEAESLTNAAMRLAADKQAVLDQLQSSNAWNGEMVDAAWMIENEFYKDFVKTGDRTAWDAWRKIETHKISETAKGLQAVAKQSRPGAAGVLNASMNLLADFRAGGEAESKGVTKQQVAKAEKQVNEVCREMAGLEAEIDERVQNGMNETEARAMSKEAWLDLSEKINRQRGTGKMFFGNGRFRKMLGNQDMDFIQRFVCCQAAGIAEDLNYKGKQDRLKQVNTWQKLAQLTGTGTWGRNITGNATFGLIDLLAVDNPVTQIADQIVGKITGRRSVGWERGVLDTGTLAASKNALERSILEVAANIDLAEDSSSNKYDLSRTRTFDPNGNALNRVLSRWEQWNGYMLTSSDRFFRGGAENSAANAIRRANERAGYNVNEAEIQDTARQTADYRLFQNDGIASEAADSIREGANKLGGKLRERVTGNKYEKGQFGIGTALMPYTKVPTNIGVKALEFSPAGAVKGLAEIIRVATDKGSTMAQQNQAVTDFGRGVTGTALIAGLAALMKNTPFFKDWEDEEDKDVKAQNKAEGKSGMQFNIDMMMRAADGDTSTEWQNGDRAIDISSIEPLNQLLTIASLMAEGKDFSSAMLSSTKDNFLQLPSVSAIKNIEDTWKYTTTPDDVVATAKTTAASAAGSVVGGMVPAPLRHAASVTDEYARDTSGSNAAQRAVNQIKSTIPGLRETLPVKTDNYGREVTQGDIGTRIANTYGSQKYSQVNQSAVSREAERLRRKTGEELTPSRNGPSSEKFGSERVKLTAEERKDWKDSYGRDMDLAVQLLMRSSIYKNADDATKAELWANLEDYARDGVKSDFAEEHDLDYKSEYEDVRELDNPITFLTTSKAFKIAEGNDTWDVVDTLIEPIRRMSEKEQELMRDKNKTLMSYYDYLVPNSDGYQASGAEAVHDYKTTAKDNATARGKQSASGIDKFKSVYDGFHDGTLSERDVLAIMTKSKTTEDEATGETNTTYDLTKGRYAIFNAAIAGGATVEQALEIVKNADVDDDGTIDEKGVKIKAEHEGTNALKRAGLPDQNAMTYAFNEVMYPWKNK